MRNIFVHLIVGLVVVIVVSCNNDDKDYASPELELIGGPVIELSLNQSYQEPGYIAVDDVDGNITDQVWIEGELNTDKVGKYRLLYNVKDLSGNWAVSSVRTIIVKNDATHLVKTYTSNYTCNSGPSGNYNMTLRVSQFVNNEIYLSSFGDSPIPNRVDVIGTVSGSNIEVDLQSIEGYWYSGIGQISNDNISFQTYTGVDSSQLEQCEVTYTPL